MNSPTGNLLRHACILIVDDELANVRFLELLLAQAGYDNVHRSMDARELVDECLRLKPDLLLLDLHMPHLDGYKAMDQLSRALPPDNYLPILVLTADTTSQAKRRALAAGAKDFLSKPLDVTEVLLRVRNLLETRFQHVLLDDRVRERTNDLQSSQVETVERLALAAEYRDDETGLHTKRVGVLAAAVGKVLGLLDDEVQLLRLAAPLHDLGKIGIHDSILLKPGRLLSTEFEIMQQHTLIGARILSGSRSRWLQVAEQIALSHHERWDGSGYPHHLCSAAIPLMGRLVAIADVFDALTHERPYKSAWTRQDAEQEIANQSGRQFDPEVVKAFLQLSRSGGI